MRSTLLDGPVWRGSRSEVRIRTLKRIDDMVPIEELQTVIWGYDKPYPARLLLVVAETGGQVQAAFSEERMIGFSFMIYGRDRHDGHPYLHSQLVGVLPEMRDQNVGFVLKLGQRRWAMELGIDKVEWTFDPLQARNGYFNVRKLGAVIRRYRPDYYGVLDSLFTQGLPTDRWFAEWFVNSPRAEARLTGWGSFVTLDDVLQPSFACATRVERSPDGLPRLVDFRLALEAERIAFEVPTDFTAVMADSALANDWRMKTRAIALYYLGQRGYAVTDCASGLDRGLRRTFYVLEKGS